MEGGDLIMLTKVSISVVISSCYCYWIGRLISAGTRRLLFIAPIICFYLFIPFNFSSVHLRGNTGFFFGWLGTFKLILFAFNKGPLSSDPKISLARFVAAASFLSRYSRMNHTSDPKPLTSNQDLTLQTPTNSIKMDHYPQIHQSIPKVQISGPTHLHQKRQKPMARAKKRHLSPTPAKVTPHFLLHAIKAILLVSLVKLYDYSDQIHPKVILGMYCFHIYFMLDMLLATFAALAKTLLGMELEPQFNKPLLSTSLQDFWGRRWNLMVTSILRPAVYQPSVKAAMIVVGPKLATLPAVFATFVVSGLMHELILYYMGGMPPTLRMMGFFVLHGFCLTVEIVLKKTIASTWRWPRFLSGLLTIGFVAATSFWLFLPEFIRCRIDVMAFEEYAALGAFVKNLSAAF